MLKIKNIFKKKTQQPEQQQENHDTNTPNSTGEHGKQKKSKPLAFPSSNTTNNATTATDDKGGPRNSIFLEKCLSPSSLQQSPINTANKTIEEQEAIQKSYDTKIVSHISNVSYSTSSSTSSTSSIQNITVPQHTHLHTDVYHNLNQDYNENSADDNTTDNRTHNDNLSSSLSLNDGSLTTVDSVSSSVEETSLSDDISSDEMLEAAPQVKFAEQLEITNYRLLNKIGEGAFSKVFDAKKVVFPTNNGTPNNNTSLKKCVAIKILNKTQLSDTHKNSNIQNAAKTSTRQQVLKEVAIHKLVSSSPYVVQFIEFQESPKYYYIVQELLPGGEIFGEIVRLTYFSEDLSRHVVRQLAYAIKHLHSLGVVHRDIKPENLLFIPIDYIPTVPPNKRKLRKSDDPTTKEDEGIFIKNVGGGGIGRVKLADFGLSKQINYTNTKTPCGTVGYTAPEVVKDQKYSMEVDMWGIGCVLYTVLCGFPPFYDEKVDILTEKISKGHYTFLEPWWDEISEGAKHCVSRLLEVDPYKRYTIEDLLNDQWFMSCDADREKNINAGNTAGNSKTSKRRSNRNKKYMDLLYSPAAVAMRDAFDISNAVQRKVEDEDINQNGNSRSTFAAAISLGALQEGEVMDNATHANSTNKNGNSIENQFFQLKLNSSTILKRRKEKNAGDEIAAAVSMPPTIKE
ncbi:related to Serine/threonine-protein kinase RCK2 [Saccharomycodes ludwigii]|uniref:Related to Serine/threonine-protein kinase RCK2 n=1 Tax=Saccharomycodes ludwigii TaxID=36035 RepID=A0A376BBX6_9ASCO|nr:hypothetical protein SCDLUD_003467 [Saccharomycodes ludwigii]KAH3900482.1 hypothetical protein SCDLUD_003467 [Saccharomycodes ludwigii]SSD62054.1 related to Serine/threonine-protein kinase RCK2 [Saccharomycodes ludwigii]